MKRDSDWITSQIKFWILALFANGSNRTTWREVASRLRQSNYWHMVSGALLTRDDIDTNAVETKYGRNAALRTEDTSLVVRELVSLREFEASHRFPIFMVDCVGPWTPLIAYNRLVHEGTMAVLWPQPYHMRLVRMGMTDEQKWDEKTSCVVFRGAMSGPLASGPRLSGKTSRLQIVVRWAKPEYNSWADVGITSVPDSVSRDSAYATDAPMLTSCMRSHLSTKQLMSNRYILCIEGADVSSGFGWALASNCVPFHPYPFAFEVRYFNGLKPWVHFVPLALDGSDLKSAFEWCEANPSCAREIAAAGRMHMDAMVDPELLHSIKFGVASAWDLRIEDFMDDT
jgi:hypothetical protein